MRKRQKSMLVLVIIAVCMAAALSPRLPCSFAGTDVTDQVELVQSSPRYDRRTGEFSVSVAVKNMSQSPLLVPVKVVIESISSPDVTVANPDGVDEGKPYYLYEAEIEGAQLEPDETSASKRWAFNNPTRARFTYEVQVWAGPALPDLMPLSLTSEPAQTCSQEGTTVEVIVANYGSQPVADVLVVFRSDGDEFARETIGEIPPDSTSTLAVYWPGGEPGPHILEAEIDPEDAIAEELEDNNTVSLEVSVVFEIRRPWEHSDLILDDFQINPSRPYAGGTVSLETRVKNEGDEPLTDILVRFLVDGEEVNQTIIPELAPGEETIVVGLWTEAAPGRRYLAAQVELPEVAERNLANNTVAGIVHVGGGAEPLPDLLVQELTLSPGDSILVTAVITNIGWVDANNLPVSLMIDSETFDEVTVDHIGPGESRELEATLNDVVDGEHTIAVVVDPGNLVPKTDAPNIFAKRYAIPTSVPVCYGTPWTSVGPAKLDSTISHYMPDGSVGRVDVIAIDPKNTNIMYAGAPTGGIWKTTKGGSTTHTDNWVPKTDYMLSLNISALVIDPSDSNVVYAGSEAGIYKSINAGNTWSVFTGTSIGTYFRTLIVSYTSTTNFSLYAGTNSGVWRYQGTDKYLTKSAPADWKKVKSGSVTDLIQHPTNPDRLYVAIYNRATKIGTIHRSKPGGPSTGDGSWDQLTTGLPATPSPHGIRLAMCVSQPDVLYASFNTPSLLAIPERYNVYRSVNGGDNWGKRYSHDKPVKDFAYAGKSRYENYYNAYIAVDPSNSNIVYTGHVNAYRSDDGANTFPALITNIHVDQHGFAFHPGDSQTVYFLGDGGIFKGINRGASCSPLNDELRVTQFFDIALTKSHPSFIIGGTQDNGTIQYGGYGYVIWKAIRDGDGRYVAIDPATSDIMYSQNQYLDSTKKGAWVGSAWTGWRGAPGLPEAKVYSGDPYFIVHPSNSNILLAAGPEVYQHTKALSDWTKCPNCSKWSPIGPKGSEVKGSVKRIAVDATSNTYYAGMSSGQVWTSTPGGTNWHKIFSHPSGRPVTGLVVDTFNPNKLWLTFEGWGKVDGPNRVWMIERIVSYLPDIIDPVVYWKTVNITSNLPTELMLGHSWKQSNMLALHPSDSNTVYVATNKGVYQGSGFLMSDGKWNWNWQAYNCYLPWVIVTDLEVHPVTKYLFAATFGRGVFTTPLFIPGE